MRTHRAVLLSGLFVSASLVFSIPIVKAQNAPTLITQPVDESKLTVLKGNTRPEANVKNDRGPVPDSFRLEHMFLQLRRSPEQERALDQLVDQLHDSNSPNFHHWLTAQEFGQRFGLAPEDLTTLTDWLQSHGFEVNVVYPNGILIDFSGTSGQVRNAFHTEIHYLDVKGVRHIANMREPQIPAALTSAVVGVVSLNDFRPHRMLTSMGPCGLNSTCYSVVPSDLTTIYNFNPLFTKGISGQGQTIVVLEDSDVYNPSGDNPPDDWKAFRSTFGLSSFTSGSFTLSHPSSGANNCADPMVVPGEAESEAIVDAEWASAGAPSAAIVLASCADTATNFGVFIALENLLNATSTPPGIVSLSANASESILGVTLNASINSLYQQAVTEGVSVFVSAGDQAAASSDRGATAATHGITVGGFATTPFNVAVGGTDFSDTFSGTSSTYWGATNPSNFGSALSYIPEIPWNDSCASVLIATFVSGSGTTYGTSGFCNSLPSDSPLLNTVGGSGGPSRCAMGVPSTPGVISGTCAGYPKPPWQSVFGNPIDGVRDIPDVSLFAGNGFWGHAYVICWSDPSQNQNGSRPCTPGIPNTWSSVGGTSVGAPIVAAIQALINQKTGMRWGNPNPTYYSLAAAEYGASGNASCNSNLGRGVAITCIFYDETHGDMDVPCYFNDSSLFNCFDPDGTSSNGVIGVLSTSNSAYQPAFGANTGWDFATGIGTINAANLVNNWPSSTVGVGFSLSPNPASLSIAAPGQSGTATITVTGTNGFTGTVSFACSVSPLPANSPPTCFANPSSIALSATTTTATANLRIATIAGLNSGLGQEKGPNKPGYLGANMGLVLACIFLLGLALPRSRKHWTASLGLVVLVLMGVALSSCASGSGGSSQINFGTPTGSYTVTLTASGGGTTQTTNVAVTVQ
jgi:hypothetical protein